MLHLLIIRNTPESLKQIYTIGEMFSKSNIQDKFHDFCYTLEDKVRDINKNGKFNDGEEKVYGETAIPFGKYKGKITWSPAFKRMMPEILNVPSFSGIRLHGGNDIGDTFGCPLIAFNTDHKGKIWKSALSALMKLIIENDPEGNFEIEII